MSKLDMAEFVELVEKYGGNTMAEPEGKGEVEHTAPKIFTAVDLMNHTFPEPRWVVPGFLPEGLTLFAGPPKIGKSWLALSLCVSTASGGVAFAKIPVERGEALYLALEDTPRRLQSRLKMMLNGEPAPEGLHLVTQWPRLNEGGLDHLEAWLETHPDSRLLIVDTLQKVRPPQGTRGLYAGDYATVSCLKTLADQYGIAMLVVHHLRKGASDNPLEEVSGTTGLTGAADTCWTLKRDRGRADAVLFSTGRDIDESETALRFDKALGLWVLLGDASEYRTTHERHEIIELLRQVGDPMRPKEISEALGKPSGAIRFLLSKLTEEGAIKKTGYGQYTYIPTTNTTITTNNTNNTNSANSLEVVASVSVGNSPSLTLLGAEGQVKRDSSASVSSVSGVSKRPPERERLEI